MIWSAVQPERSLAGLPQGWLGGHKRSGTVIANGGFPEADWAQLEQMLQALFQARHEPLVDWIRERTSLQTHTIDVAIRDADLETIINAVSRMRGADAESD